MRLILFGTHIYQFCNKKYVMHITKTNVFELEIETSRQKLTTSLLNFRGASSSLELVTNELARCGYFIQQHMWKNSELNGFLRKPFYIRDRKSVV